MFVIIVQENIQAGVIFCDQMSEELKWIESSSRISFCSLDKHKGYNRPCFNFEKYNNHIVFLLPRST